MLDVCKKTLLKTLTRLWQSWGNNYGMIVLCCIFLTRLLCIVTFVTPLQLCVFCCGWWATDLPKQGLNWWFNNCSTNLGFFSSFMQEENWLDYSTSKSQIILLFVSVIEHKTLRISTLWCFLWEENSQQYKLTSHQIFVLLLLFHKSQQNWLRDFFFLSSSRSHPFHLNCARFLKILLLLRVHKHTQRHSRGPLGRGGGDLWA